MYLHRLIVLVLLFSIYSAKVENLVVINCEIAINQDFESQKKYCLDSIESIKGLIVMNTKNELIKNNKLSIYNLDGVLYSEVELNNDKIITAYKCLDYDNEFFIILLDGTKKFLKRNDERIIFQTWEDHILNNVFAVNFDDKVNSIRKSIRGEDLKINLSNNRRVIPISIEGYFMKVKYQDFSTNSSIIGWIQWRNEMCLLVELLYFA